MTDIDSSSSELVQKLRVNIEKLRAQGEVRLPSEQELSRTFGVNRYKVRRALQRLAMEGVIHPVRGRGFFFELPALDLSPKAIPSFTRIARSAGEIPRSRLLSIELDYAEPAIQEALELSDPAVVWSLRIMRFLGRYPFSLSYSYLPRRTFPGLGKEMRNNQSLHDTLKRCYGLQVRRFQAEYEAVAAHGEQARYLAVPVSFPLMKSTSLNLDEGHEPVEYCMSWIRSDRFKLSIRAS